MMQVMKDYLEWFPHLNSIWWLHLLQDKLRNSIYLSPVTLRLELINLLYEIMSLIHELLLSSRINCIHCYQSSRSERAIIDQLHWNMIHSSLDLPEPSIIWLISIDAYFILYQLKDIHWIETSKFTF
jgi:hypothetical protein